MRKVDLIATLLCLAIASSLRAQEADFEDLESRIDYAYFTEDANALRAVIQTAAASVQKGSQGGSTAYALALAHYRLGLLLVTTAKQASAEAMSHCVSALARVIDTEPKSAEGLALQSACYAELDQLRHRQLMAHATLSKVRMEKAMKLAPANPRAILIDGVRDYAKADTSRGSKTDARDKFHRAVTLFETQHDAIRGTPSWGHADAYLYLGRSLMEGGDTLGARNALERALIIAPEFAAARRELHRLMSDASRP